MINWCAWADILNAIFSLIIPFQIISGLENSPAYVFLLKKFKTDILIALKPTGFEL